MKTAADFLPKAKGQGTLVAARLDGQVVDLSRAVPDSSQIEPVYLENDDGLEVCRHTAAHVMAQAMKRLHPEAQVTIGPVIENGFYYDFSLAEPLTPEDLDKLEIEMKKIVKENHEVTRTDMSRQEAMEKFGNMNEKYKVEIIEDLPDQKVSLYTQGEFTDLCRGPHLPETSLLKAFKITHMAGAYWRGDEKNEMLQRVYGTAWATQKELDDHLERLEEAAKRDHRKLGKTLDLFSFLPEAPGAVFWHPKGATIFHTLMQFSRTLQSREGYQEIVTPNIIDESLWRKSGHWEFFHENMFFTESENRRFAIKPMNCPAAIMVFRSKLRSYKDLPLRLMDYGVLHRNERSGTLHGLMRLRRMVQDDAHIFVTPEQIEGEIQNVLKLVDRVYKVFGLDTRIELSTRPEKALGDPKIWDRAESALRMALEKSGHPYTINPGDGAFYGPKIDVHVKDSLGRSWQCGTIQLDFYFPGKLEASYIGQDSKKHQPILIHRAILGTLERFIGILIEHTAGALPVWLSPLQVMVIPISDKFSEYANEVCREFTKSGIRAEVDGRSEKMGYKIREAQEQKVPYMAVVGGREESTRTVSLRERLKGDLGAVSLEEAVTDLAAKAMIPLAAST